MAPESSIDSEGTMFSGPTSRKHSRHTEPSKQRGARVVSTQVNEDNTVNTLTSSPILVDRQLFPDR